MCYICVNIINSTNYVSILVCYICVNMINRMKYPCVLYLCEYDQQNEVFLCAVLYTTGLAKQCHEIFDFIISI